MSGTPQKVADAGRELLREGINLEHYPMKLTIKNTFVEFQDDSDKTPMSGPPKAKTESALTGPTPTSMVDEEDEDEEDLRVTHKTSVGEDLRSSGNSAGGWSATPQSNLYQFSGTPVQFFPATSSMGNSLVGASQPLQGMTQPSVVVEVGRDRAETDTTAQPYKVKNTFIDLDEPELDMQTRDGRRTKTTPAFQFVADEGEDDMERDMPTFSVPLPGHVRAATVAPLPLRASPASPTSPAVGLVRPVASGRYVQSSQIVTTPSSTASPKLVHSPVTIQSSNLVATPMSLQSPQLVQTPSSVTMTPQLANASASQPLMVLPAASVAPMPQPVIAASPTSALSGRDRGLSSISAVSSGASPSQPFVIKNTFIDVDEATLDRRHSRKMKTMPASAVAYMDASDEEDGTATQPVMRLSMPSSDVPVQLQPTRSLGSHAASSGSPATVPVTVSLSSLTGPTTLGFSGRVWALSQEKEGCLQIQKVLEAGSGNSDDSRAALVAELQGHVREGLSSPHANFVLRKCVTDVPWPAVKFFIDELLEAGPEAVQEAARHRYGCRIIEALLVHCPIENTNPMGEILLADAVGLGSHMYGNFVIQRLLTRDAPSQQSRLRQLLVGNVATLGPNFYGSVVLGQALRTGAPEEQVLLARHMVGTAGLLAAIIRFKHGNQIKDRVLELLPDAERAEVEAQLTATPLRAPAGTKGAAASAPAPAKAVNPVRSVQINQQTRKAKVIKSQAVPAPALPPGYPPPFMGPMGPMPMGAPPGVFMGAPPPGFFNPFLRPF